MYVSLLLFGDDVLENIFFLNSYGVLIICIDLYEVICILEIVEWNVKIVY